MAGVSACTDDNYVGTAGSQRRHRTRNDGRGHNEVTILRGIVGMTMRGIDEGEETARDEKRQ